MAAGRVFVAVQELAAEQGPASERGPVECAVGIGDDIEIGFLAIALDSGPGVVLFGGP